MSSHGRPCYNALSDYTKNGYNPIIAPTLATTSPEIFTFLTAHNFKQTEQNINRIHSINYGQTNCGGYKMYGQMCGNKNNNQLYENYNNDKQLHLSFNDFSINKNF